MEKIKQRRYGAKMWRKILGRFEESGMTAQAFCAREGISTKSLRRWQLRLEGDSDRALIAKAAQLTNKPGGFIDLGDLRSGTSRYEVRLELGAGVVLSIARG
ncbi:MAG: IS66 family insertion sequence element accessory protein TnpA [Steroidobacteraceae bacterium]